MKEVYIRNVQKDEGDNHLLGEELIVSDGYHTFDELYDHRITLFITLCQFIANYNKLVDSQKLVAYQRLPWRSRFHSDGSEYPGWFILGINKNAGMQVTYHVPLSRWNETDFVETLEKAPEYDGHSSIDVLERLKHL